MPQPNINLYAIRKLPIETKLYPQTQHTYCKKINGFSLVELMAVVVILGILISIAIPAYSSYVRHSREMRATTQLQTIAMKLEQHYNRTMNYQTNLEELNLSLQDDWFRYRIESDHQKSYTIIASPLNNRLSLQEFRLNHYGLHQRRLSNTRNWINGWS